MMESPTRKDIEDKALDGLKRGTQARLEEIGPDRSLADIVEELRINPELKRGK